MALKRNGRVLFVHQHRNSYFKKVSARPKTELYLDGWITKTKSCGYYYGIMNKEKVLQIISKQGFIARDVWVDGESNFVLASKAG